MGRGAAMPEQVKVPQEQPNSEPWIYMLGRDSADEYLSFVIRAASGAAVDIPGEAARWRQAASIVEALSLAEQGAADNPETQDLPSSVLDAATEYLDDPAVAASYALVPPTIALVPLDKLVVFQREVDLTYANELRDRI